MFTNVRVYMTSKSENGNRIWFESNLTGNLRVLMLQYVGVPISAIRLNAVDKGGLER